MRRRYKDCQHPDGNCDTCRLVRGMKDCHGEALTKLTMARLKSGLTQAQLARKSGVHLRLIQKIESGESKPENITAKTLLGLSDALSVDPHDLIR